VSDQIVGFNIRLLEKMAERDITQADLCRLTGLATSMVSHYCNGQRIPSVPVAIKIAKVLYTTVEYLAYGNYSHRKSVNDDILVDAENKSNYKAEPVLCECSLDEQTMIEKFRSLNDDGQRRIVDYVDDIISVKKYHQ
jgi:transcriptional regulator with XRE-family HTH domain